MLGDCGQVAAPVVVNGHASSPAATSAFMSANAAWIAFVWMMW